MPKAKSIRIYEKEGRPYRSDFELVKLAQKGNKAAQNEMWDKYFELRQKKRFEFLALCRNNKIDGQDDFDNWDAAAWEKYIAQMDGVRLHDIKSPETWQIWIRLNGYFQSMNRDLIHAILKKRAYETQERTIGDDDSKQTTTNIDIAAEEADLNSDPMKKLARDIFNQSYQKMELDLDKKQLKLLAMKQQNKSMKDICDTLGVSKGAVKSTLDYAKNRLGYWIENTSSKANSPMTYSDILEYL